jgi:outer membrane receptor protein involved in Fe transport
VAEEQVEVEIVVTGSNIRGRRDGPSPVQVRTRQELEREGSSTVAEAIAALPQNFGGTANEDTVLTGTDRSIQNPTLGSSANLRGLGSDATLTLVNGRRLPGAGSNGDFVDLSVIPFAAVERIEILPDGASAIYGSDAIGGVVNIILRRRFEGAETRLRVGTATQGNLWDYQFAQVAGSTWSTGSVLLAYEFNHRDNLANADRAFTRNADLRPRGDDFRNFLSNPGTIVGLDPATGALVPRFAIPTGQNGTGLTPSDFRVGSNLMNNLAFTDLLPEQTRHSGFVLARQDVAPGVELFLEGRYGSREFAYRGPAFATVFQVNRNNPFFVSPDGSSSSLIGYSFQDELGPVRVTGDVETWSGTVGVTADLGAGWGLTADAGVARQFGRTGSANLVNISFLNEALGTAPDNPATEFNPRIDGYFNPYGDGAVNGERILSFLGQGYIAETMRSGVLIANLKLDGPLVELPGGPVSFAAGAAYRREEFFREGESFLFGTRPQALVSSDTDRDIAALYGEVAVPLFGEGNAIPGVRRLELSAAARYERYSDFGSSINPRVGLLWEPVTGFRLRGSYGTSFRAPGLRALNDPTNVGLSQLPDAAGRPNTVLFLTGGNPDLEPERASSWSVGTQFRSPSLAGLVLDATLFETRFSNRIGQPAFEDRQLALRDAAFSPFVRFVSPATDPGDRAAVVELMSRPGSTVPAFFPPELIRAIVDGRYVNTAKVLVRGLDVLLSQRFPLAGGEASVSANASYLFNFRRQTTPAAIPNERVDTIGNPPELRARVTGSWDRPTVGATLTANYLDGYLDDLSRPARPVPAWLTFDLQLRIRPEWAKFLGDSAFSLSIQNLLGSDPPFVNRAPGQAYDAANADPIGRFVALQMITRW